MRQREEVQEMLWDGRRSTLTRSLAPTHRDITDSLISESVEWSERLKNQEFLARLTVNALANDSGRRACFH